MGLGNRIYGFFPINIKQYFIVDSTMEVEYVVTFEATKKVVYLRKFLMKLMVIPHGCIAHDTILSY